MTKFIVYTECAIEFKNKFLIILRPKNKHAEGLLSFPGGKFEVSDGEGQDVLKNAIIREIQEELGLEINDPIQYISSSFFMDSKIEAAVVDIIFYCKLEKTIVDVKPSEREVPEYYWLSHEEILKQDNCPPWLVKYLQLIKQETAFLENTSLE